MLHACTLVLVLFLPLFAQGDTEAAWRAVNDGIALLEQYTPEKAALKFEAALKLDPKLNAARINLAIALHHQAKSEEALKVAEAAQAAEPQSPHAHYLVGLAARQTGDVAKANAAFSAVLRLDPDDTSSAIHLARLLIEQGQLEKAVELLRPAVEREPFNTTALYALATTLQRLGQRDEARPLLLKFQGLRNSGYATSLGTQYLEAGRYAHAVCASGATQPFTDSEPALRFELLAAQPSTKHSSRYTAVTEILSKSAAEGLAHFPREVQLADLDQDGDADALVSGPTGLVQWTNDKGSFAHAHTLHEGPCTGAVAADMNGDGVADIVVLMANGLRILLRGQEPSTVVDIPLGDGTPLSATALDADHDGDLDLLVGSSKATHYFRQAEPGRFDDKTSTLGVALPEQVFMTAASDLDLGRDVDFLLGSDTADLIPLRNLRDGTFRIMSEVVDGKEHGKLTAFALADFNKDGIEDLVLSGTEATTLCASRGTRYKSTAIPLPAALDAIVAADFDADGWIDLAGLKSGAVQILRGTPHGLRPFKECNASSASLAHATLAAADVDLDGDMDLVGVNEDGSLVVLRNALSKAHSIHVSLKGRVSNKTGLGTRIDIRAGSLAQKLEIGASAPMTRAASALVGLAHRERADAVRLLWPSGNVQAELPPASAGLGTPWCIEEVDRKPSSCPNVYVWDGERQRFLSDFLGGGEMGSWVSEGVRNSPDPVEYLRIPSEILRPKQGAFDIRITNELEEALFLDHVSLLAIDHPRELCIYPNEGLTFSAPKPWRVHALKNPRIPVSARDDQGVDHTQTLARADGRAVDGLVRDAIRGFARPHQLMLEWDATPPHPVLLLTGWTEYAWSSDTRRAEQGGQGFEIPRLEYRAEDGIWRTLCDDLGIPVGHPQTMAVALEGLPTSGPLALRISTNMCVRYDTVALAEGVPAFEPRMSRLLPNTANLRWRGFSQPIARPGSDLGDFDYSVTTGSSPWKTFAGRYTRCGDVRPLLSGVDDVLVVATSGDEVQLTFEEQALPDLPEGWTRTFLLHAHGWSKEMDPNSATPDALLPLPFSAMTQYPYGAGEARPAHEFWVEIMEQTRSREIRGRLPFTPSASGR